eukprot:g1341.t1
MPLREYDAQKLLSKGRPLGFHDAWSPWTKEGSGAQDVDLALRYEYEYQLRRLALQLDKIEAGLRYAPESLNLLEKRAKIQACIEEVHRRMRRDIDLIASQRKIKLDDGTVLGNQTITKVVEAHTEEAKDDGEAKAEKFKQRLEETKEVDDKNIENIEDKENVKNISSWSWKGRSVQIVPSSRDQELKHTRLQMSSSSSSETSSEGNVPKQTSSGEPSSAETDPNESQIKIEVLEDEDEVQAETDKHNVLKESKQNEIDDETTTIDNNDDKKKKKNKTTSSKEDKNQEEKSSQGDNGKKKEKEDGSEKKNNKSSQEGKEAKTSSSSSSAKKSEKELRDEIRKEIQSDFDSKFEAMNKKLDFMMNLASLQARVGDLEQKLKDRNSDGVEEGSDDDEEKTSSENNKKNELTSAEEESKEKVKGEEEKKSDDSSLTKEDKSDNNKETKNEDDDNEETKMEGQQEEKTKVVEENNDDLNEEKEKPIPPAVLTALERYGDSETKMLDNLLHFRLAMDDLGQTLTVKESRELLFDAGIINSSALIDGQTSGDHHGESGEQSYFPMTYDQFYRIYSLYFFVNDNDSDESKTTTTTTTPANLQTPPWSTSTSLSSSWLRSVTLARLGSERWQHWINESGLYDALGAACHKIKAVAKNNYLKEVGPHDETDLAFTTEAIIGNFINPNLPKKKKEDDITNDQGEGDNDDEGKVKENDDDDDDDEGKQVDSNDNETSFISFQWKINNISNDEADRERLLLELENEDNEETDPEEEDQDENQEEEEDDDDQEDDQEDDQDEEEEEETTKVPFSFTSKALGIPKTSANALCIVFTLKNDLLEKGSDEESKEEDEGDFDDDDDEDNELEERRKKLKTLGVAFATSLEIYLEELLPYFEKALFCESDSLLLRGRSGFNKKKKKKNNSTAANLIGCSVQYPFQEDTTRLGLTLYLKKQVVNPLWFLGGFSASENKNTTNDNETSSSSSKKASEKKRGKNALGSHNNLINAFTQAKLLPLFSSFHGSIAINAEPSEILSPLTWLTKPMKIQANYAMKRRFYKVFEKATQIMENKLSQINAENEKTTTTTSGGPTQEPTSLLAIHGPLPFVQWLTGSLQKRLVMLLALGDREDMAKSSSSTSQQTQSLRYKNLNAVLDAMLKVKAINPRTHTLAKSAWLTATKRDEAEQWEGRVKDAKDDIGDPPTYIDDAMTIWTESLRTGFREIECGRETPAGKYMLTK